MSFSSRRKKMRSRNLIHRFGVVIVVCLLFAGSAMGAEKPSLIKLATLAPEGSSWMKTLTALNAEVLKKTGSQVQFRIYPGGVLGDEKDVLRKLKIGQIQGAVLTASGLSNLIGDIDVLQIPFLFQNYEEVDFILKRVDPLFRKAIEESGHVLLGWSEVGFIYLMSTVPISGVADLRRAKVWSWEESPMAKAIFDEAGVTAIPLSIPDVLVGLQTGLVDVVYTPPTGAIALQWFTKIKYLTDVPLAYLAAGMIITKEAFQKIPSSFQTTLMEVSQRHLDQLKGVIRQENQEAIKVMVKQGVKVVTPSREQIGEFKSLSSKAIEHIHGSSFSKKTLTEVTSALESYRKGVK
jgi:TRAP-type C4-dicarboxylate transport system substrate-binding protein